MKYLLDTNVVSEMRKPKPHGGVMKWLRSLAPNDIAVCALTFGEMQHGIELTRMRDALKAREIEEWLEEFQASVVVLDLDARCFRLWARMMVGKSDQLREDGLIAASALIHGMTIATRNVKDFLPFGVDLFNPFEKSA